MRLRQEVINVVLAQLLEERGLAAVPEQIIRVAAQPGARMPDVIIDFQGLRLAIEGEFASRDNAEQLAEQKARERVEHGLAHVGVALIYPVSLQSAEFRSLKARIGRARLRFAILTEVAESPPFVEGSIEELGEALRRAYEQLGEERAVSRAVAVIEAGIERFVEAMRGQRATTQRSARVLGIAGGGAASAEVEDGR